MKYLDLHMLDLTSVVDLPWFQAEVRELSATPIHLWRLGEFHGWYTGYEDLLPICMKDDIDALQQYSLAYLSPCEYPDYEKILYQYRMLNLEQDAMQAYKDIMDQYDIKKDVVSRATDRYQPEWYCLLHHCQLLNANLTLPMMQHLYPDTKWYYIDTLHHAFVTNTLDLHESDTYVTTTDITEPLVVDLYWGNTRAAFKDIGPIRTTITDAEEASTYARENYI